MKSKISKLLLSVATLTTLANAEVLTLSKAYEMALAKSSDVKSWEYQLKAGEEKIEYTKSKLYPQLSLASAYGRDNHIVESSVSSEYDYESTETIENHKISLSQMIYDPEVYANIKMEKAKVKVFEARTQLQKQELIQQLLKVYLDILKAENKIELQSSIVEYNKYRLKAIKKEYSMKLANKMDLLEAQVEYNNSMIALKKERDNLTINRVKLSNMIKNDNFEMPKISYDDKFILADIELMKSMIYEDNIDNNLNIKQAKYTIEQYRHELDASRAGHYPKLYFDASYATYAEQSRAMLSLQIPIYQGGATSSRVRSSIAYLSSAKEDLATTQDEIKIQYNELKSMLDAAIESTSLYTEAIESAKLYVKSIEQGYEHELKSIIDLYEAKSKLLDIKSQYIENIYTLVDSYVAILILTNNFNNLQYVDNVIK
jgi:outer membrane protein TolC